MNAERHQRSPLALSDLGLLAEKCRDVYAEAAPWAHVVLDGLFDPSFVAEAEVQEFPRALELKLQKGQGRLLFSKISRESLASERILHMPWRASTSVRRGRFKSCIETSGGIRSLVNIIG